MAEASSALQASCLKKKAKSSRADSGEEGRPPKHKGDKVSSAKPSGKSPAPPVAAPALPHEGASVALEAPPVPINIANVWGDGGFPVAQVLPSPNLPVTPAAAQAPAAFMPPPVTFPQASYLQQTAMAPMDQAHFHAAVAASVQQYMAGIQHFPWMMPPTALPPTTSAVPSPFMSPSLEQSVAQSTDEEREEGECDPAGLSEDEELVPEQPQTAGLFPPEMFKSLLRKARVTASLPEAPAAPPDKAAPSPNPIFTLQTLTSEIIPAPQLFVENIQQQFTTPTAGPMPSSADKSYFNVANDLASILVPPTVDPPVASLHSPTAIPGEAEELLKPEERRIEQVLIKNHLSSAWAAKAASSSSFFSRSAFLWLRELQEQIPTTEARLHQDLNKIIAATQFAADATLRAARFSAKAIATATVGRRLNWLRGWTADARQKWRLAATPIKGSLLFGTVLDPILVESKDKKKIMPSLSKKGTNRFAPYPKRPFRQADLGSHQPRAPGQYNPRPYYQDRSYRGRQFKRPYRGNTSKFSRRGK